MKRIFSMFLAAALALTLAACGAPAESQPASSAAADSAPAESLPADSTPAEPVPDAELAALVDALYAECPLEETFAVQTRAVRLDDADSAVWDLSLQSGEVLADVEAAVVSDSPINAQAYTLALLRLKDGADAEAVAQRLLEDAHVRKWICVMPSAVAVAGHGNVLCYVMADAELADARALADAFGTAAGGADLMLAEDVDTSAIDDMWGQEGIEVPELDELDGMRVDYEQGTPGD